MRADELFVHTLDDLEDLVRGPLPGYRVLGIAGLLRKLLIDDNPLVDQVNRHHRQCLTFVVSDSRQFEELVKSMGAMFMTAEDGIDPEGARKPAQIDVRRPPHDRCFAWKRISAPQVGEPAPS